MSAPRVTLKAVGDIGLNAGIGELVARHGAEHLFGPARESLGGADLLFGNLEMPLAPKEARAALPEVRETLRADPAHAAALRSAGFGILSLANNHIMDFGPAGMRATREALDGLGIRHAGAGEDLAEARRPAILHVSGLRIGLLAYARTGRHSATARAPGAAPLSEEMIVEDLARLAGRVELRVVSLHFGQVYSDYPEPADREMARRLIEAGADLILGHHPHVVQGVERRGRGLIAYSLGEFLFDPACGHIVSRVAADARRDTVVLSVTLTPDGVVAHALTPLRIGEDLRPAPPEGARAKEAAERLEHLCTAAAQDDGTLFSSQVATRTVRHQRDVFLHHVKRGNVGILARWLIRVRPRHLLLLFRSLARRGAPGTPPRR